MNERSADHSFRECEPRSGTIVELSPNCTCPVNKINDFNLVDDI
jgi:hypothetical protein